MIDLISRQALRDAMYHEVFETDTEMQRWDSGCWIRYKLFEKIIDNLSSADASLMQDRCKIDSFNQKLAKIAKDNYTDPETSHYYADKLMVKTLEDLGFDLQPFKDMVRWYA